MDTSELTPPEAGAFAETFGAVLGEVGRVVLGQPSLLRGVLVALVAGGHALLEGPPGLGKTLVSRTLAETMGVGFRRLQFTPDLMPSDVTGGYVLDPRNGAFEFRPGPVFTQILLADEINRAPAKTQSALLEAMSDRQVSVEGVTRALEEPFFVMATQNPVESEGTYALPEAQLDRFLFKLLVAAPSVEVEAALLAAVVHGFDPADLARAGVRQVLDRDALLALREVPRRVRVAPDLLTYIARLVHRTRHHPAVALGASPRASIGLLLAARVEAAADGRTYAVPDDVQAYAHDVLRHRLILHPDAQLDGVSAERVVDEVLAAEPVPKGAKA